ncbi:hypothetical protein DUI87_15567 [Hirundo rustica rustica]|uniref:Uncharacterized protein n=1 Tax=Hirundo rustica rustica TaxID=333673 RepID=A0A3M0KG93_HIRRU|nr:hypothetical protein DUI87_15567 [Hirundo rustica rustica]
MCHEGAESQLGGPSVEHSRSSSEAGETRIHTGSTPAMSASRPGEPDFLDHSSRIPALQHLYQRDVISTELISPFEVIWKWVLCYCDMALQDLVLSGVELQPATPALAQSPPGGLGRELESKRERIRFACLGASEEIILSEYLDLSFLLDDIQFTQRSSSGDHFFQTLLKLGKLSVIPAELSDPGARHCSVPVLLLGARGDIRAFGPACCDQRGRSMKRRRRKISRAEKCWLPALEECKKCLDVALGTGFGVMMVVLG